ncbi:hypothetical protein FSP39_007212, partial [Pinctada imbricata]
QASGSDLKELLPGVLKLLAHHDLVVKKFVYGFLASYANKNPDVALLSVNTLSQECSDSNPMVRGLALKTLCSMNHESFAEYGLRAVSQGLNDKSAYVRRIAVTCCGRFYHQKIDLYNDGGLINQLYGMLRDSDSIVIVNAVMILEGILREEGGIVINTKIAHHLLNKLDQFSSWGLSYIFMILKKYTAKSEDEVFDVINILDKYLTHNNASVSCECLQLFLHFIKEMPNLRPEVFRRSFESISRILNHGNSELVFILLQFIDKFSEDFIHVSLLQSHHQLLYCKKNEPVYLKMMKLHLLPMAASSQNVLEIIEEVSLLGKSSDKQVSQCAVKSIKELMSIEPSCVGVAIRKLKLLLETSEHHVFSSVLQVFQTLDLQDNESVSDIMSTIHTKFHLLKEENGQLAFLTILSCNSQHIANGAYILEEFLDLYEESYSDIVKCYVLSTCVKLFFSHPASTQSILGRLLEVFSHDANVAVRDQALFHYSVLSQGVSVAREILV